MQQIDLKVLIPSGLFIRKSHIERVTAETSAGMLELRPNHEDGVLELPPGVLHCHVDDGTEVNLAIHHGLLIKTGRKVLIWTCDALGQVSREKLNEMVKKYRGFTREASFRSILTRMKEDFTPDAALFAST